MSVPIACSMAVPWWAWAGGLCLLGLLVIDVVWRGRR